MQCLISGIPVVENVESFIEAQLDVKMLAYKEGLEIPIKENCSAAAIENADEDTATVEAMEELTPTNTDSSSLFMNS